MSTDHPELRILTERPVLRADQFSEIDVAIDLITAKRVETQSANYSINLCIVIDKSGSMEGEKIEQAKNSCLEIFRSLGSQDRFTVLAFDNEVISIVNPQTPKELIPNRILSLEADGGTNLSNGWYLGLLELQTYSSEKHLNRLILLSDGQANEGEQKVSVLGSESARARNDFGITTSTIGIGTDFQEDILAALAVESGGRFWFIGEARIEDIVREEFSGALSIVLERPSIHVEFSSGLDLVKELNELPKISKRYRLRPIKGNDQFSFAFRLRVDPDRVVNGAVSIMATLFDGAGVVEKVTSNLNLVPFDEYVKVPEDPRVATTVRKYLAATSDEKITEKMDEGDVTTMLEMLDSQSELMKELEAKLAGANAISWEQRNAEEQARIDQEIVRLQMEITENDALRVVGELLKLAQGLGLSQHAVNVLSHSRKMHKQRGMRNRGWDKRVGMDDEIAEGLLGAAVGLAKQIEANFPELKDEIAAILGRLNEQMARFS